MLYSPWSVRTWLLNEVFPHSPTYALRYWIKWMIGPDRTINSETYKTKYFSRRYLFIYIIWAPLYYLQCLSFRHKSLLHIIFIQTVFQIPLVSDLKLHFDLFMIKLDLVVSEISMLLKRMNVIEVYNKNWWEKIKD